MIAHQFRQGERIEVEAIVALINEAYAPAESFLYDGPRIDVAEVREHMQRGAFLLQIAPDATLRGCVYVEITGQRGYLGLLAVRPAHQGQRLAGAIIAAAEAFCRDRGCRVIELTIVNHRAELVTFYGKAGYSILGQRPFGSDRLKLPSHFVVMGKDLNSVDVG